MKSPILVLLALSVSFWARPLWAKTVRYELVIRNEKVNLSGKKEVDFALTVNGGIPAPVLEFTEGDDAEILVKNEVRGEEVSIHWHGILLPPEEDGVAYVNTPPIHPGTSHLFKFRIRQHGTYWYHSHTGVQEQKGVYGAFIIHPKTRTIPYDKDVVVVLSDWSDENSDQILRNLRKDGDYYLYKKDSIRSISGAWRAKALGTYFANEWSRMGGMDLSDVGYDAFLINGKRETQLLAAHPHERIRIRIINAGASSYFHVSLGQEPMTVISADGVDIEPVRAKELLMGMAETYDLLFTPSEHKNYELRATAQDVTGFASGWIGMGEKVRAPDKPLPDFYAPMDHSGHGTDDHDTHHGHGAHHSSPAARPDAAHDHAGHTVKKAVKSSSHDHAATSKPAPKDEVDFSDQSGAVLVQNHSRKGFPRAIAKSVEILTVDSLRALEPTKLPAKAQVHDLKLVLGGDMERYVWHLNGETITQDRLIHIDKGENVRITFVNDTMMHHPMHLHGHFFRVLNEAGDLSPLKHTVDVPPHQSRIIEFHANEPGQWMLHCHNLYHMKNGMARVIRYRDFKLTPEMARHDAHDPHLHDHLYTSGRFEAASHQVEAQFKVMRTWDELDLRLESRNAEGRHFSSREDWEGEGDLVYRRWFGNFFNLVGGASLHHEKGYGILGAGMVLPMLVESQLVVNQEGRFRLDLEKKLQWTSRVFTDIHWIWRPGWEGERDHEFKATLMYGPSWHWAAGLLANDRSLGIGARIQF